ncbi:MAG: hypothetical protein EBZ77_11560, partial [Chitinophagia bacterium]|nr:hypothetical protein [Chitinophagia bacterium]
MNSGTALKYIAVSLTLLVAAPVAILAQGDKFGSNNLYYNRQYNDGDYTNARYEDRTYTFNDFYENLAPYG